MAHSTLDLGSLGSFERGNNTTWGLVSYEPVSLSRSSSRAPASPRTAPRTGAVRAGARWSAAPQEPEVDPREHSRPEVHRLRAAGLREKAAPAPPSEERPARGARVPAAPRATRVTTAPRAMRVTAATRVTAEARVRETRAESADRRQAARRQAGW